MLVVMRTEMGIWEEEEKVVPEEGIEPPTKGLWVPCSTAELLWHSTADSLPMKKNLCKFFQQQNGAGIYPGNI